MERNVVEKARLILTFLRLTIGSSLFFYNYMEFLFRCANLFLISRVVVCP